MSQPAAVRELLRCCGSTRWARAMAAARPFASIDTIREAADKIWNGLDGADWKEAFAAHPRIGERTSSGEPGPREHEEAHEDWSAEEQSRVGGARGAVRARLSGANRAYDARFGYKFIVCATGRTAEEMLAMLQRRLINDPDDELQIAAEEQRKITGLRIAKLLDERQ